MKYNGFILILSLVGFSCCAQDLVPKIISPIDKSREALIQIDKSDHSRYAVLFSVNKDTSFIFLEDQKDTCLLATEWGHSTFPIKFGNSFYTFSNFRDQTIVRKIVNGHNCDSTVLDDQTDVVFSTSQGELLLIKEYPYLFENDSCDEFVTIRKLTSDLELVWTTQIRRKYQNLSGALWTSRVACSDDYILVVDPLSNDISFVSVEDGSRVEYQLSCSKESWSYKMDSTYATWIKESYVPIKARLGDIMYSWQKMDCEHIESVYNLDSVFIVLKTFDFVSKAHVFSPIFGELFHFSIDSVETRSLLGKRLEFNNLQSSFLKKTISNDTMVFLEQTIDLEKYFKIPCYVEGNLFCVGCINKDFEGIVVLKSRSRVDDVTRMHKFSIICPNATILFVSDIDKLGLSKNNLILLSYNDLKRIIYNSKRNVSNVY
jgi:hypothetical protein